MSFTFFRKYNKLILAVGGSLLMVVFLIPSAGDLIGGRPTESVVGRVGDRALTVGDRRRAASEMQLAMRLFDHADWVRRTMPQGGDSAIVWLLGLEEARRIGVWVGDAEVDARLSEFGVTRDRVASIKAQLNISDAFVRQSVRHLLIWERLRNLAVRPAKVSQPEVRQLFRQLYAELSGKVVKVEPDYLVEEVEAPTESELADRFRLNRTDAPGEGQYGFGYRLPPRVKLEYIAVPLDSIRSSIEIDEVDARVYYREHQDEFVTESGEVEPYEEVREALVERLAGREAERRQRRAVALIEAELAEALRGVDRDPTTGYYRLPEGWEGPGLWEVAERVQRAEGVGFLPTVARIEDRWLTMDDVRELEGLGEATIEVSQPGRRPQRVSAAGYVETTRDLGQSRAQQRLPSLRLQVGVASRPLTGPDGTRYIFRVTEARAPQPPASLEQVREQVVEDVKRLKAFQLLKERAEEYKTEAVNVGLEGLASSLGEEAEVVEVGPFSQRMLFRGLGVVPPQVPGVGWSEAFVDRAFEMAREAMGGEAEAGVFGELPAEKRMGTIALEDQLAMYVVEWTDYVPPYVEDYATARAQIGMLVRELDSLRGGARASNPFTLEALAARVGYTPEERRDEEEEEAELPPGEKAERPADAPEAEREQAMPAEEGTP